MGSKMKKPTSSYTRSHEIDLYLSMHSSHNKVNASLKTGKCVALELAAFLRQLLATCEHAILNGPVDASSIKQAVTGMAATPWMKLEVVELTEATIQQRYSFCRDPEERDRALKVSCILKRLGSAL